MNYVKGFLSRKFIFFFSFLLLLAVFLYLNRRYDKPEISYAIIYIIFGMMISLFYILKDFIYNPDRMNYRQVIMEDALFNHKGDIIEEFESYPLYQEFITFHLTRKSDDPYSENVTSIQAVRYLKHKMVDSLFIPLETTDPILKNYTLPLNEAIGKFLRYAGDLPIIIYNQPFTHTYLNVKLDKEVHISFIDAMKMSKDLYGLANKPLRQVQKHLRIYNLGQDHVSDAKIIGAVYLDYIYTVSTYRAKEARRMAKKGQMAKNAAISERRSFIPEMKPEKMAEESMLLRQEKEMPKEDLPEKKDLPEKPGTPEKKELPQQKDAPDEKKLLSSPAFSEKVPEEERRIISHKEADKSHAFDSKFLDRAGRMIQEKASRGLSFLKGKVSQDQSLEENHTNHKDTGK